MNAQFLDNKSFSIELVRKNCTTRAAGSTCIFCANIKFRLPTTGRSENWLHLIILIQYCSILRLSK